jgi:molecular chaperone DnaJ
MNFYEILGVEQSSTEDEIKKRYKKLARQYHPDVNPNNPEAEAKFKEISAAYNILGDVDKRKKYDQELRQQNFAGFPGFGFSGFSGYGGDPFDVFRNLGGNLHLDAKIQIAFLDAKHLQTKSIKFTRKGPCKPCNGSGAKSYKQTACSLCRGRGSVTQILMGAFKTMQTCQACNGKGRQVAEPCNSCNNGLISETAELKVNIPAGIQHDQILRLAGEGNRSATARGDLRLRVEILPDPRWRREGTHVHSSLEVDYPTLILGGNAEIDTIWGKEKINIPPKTKAGTKISLLRKGFPYVNNIHPSEKGTHFITLNLKIPNLNTPEHKNLLQGLKSLYDATST